MKKINFNNVYAWPLPSRCIVFGAVFVAVFVMGYFLDITKLHDELAASQKKEQDLKQQLGMLIGRQSALVVDISQLPALQKLLIEWRGKMINYSELPELLNDILKAGATHRVYFSLFNPGEEIKDSGYLKVPIKVTAVGSYHQLSAFMSQVANMPSIVVIGDFVITRENKNDMLGSKLAEIANSQNLLTAELTLEIYHLPEKGQVDSAAPDAPVDKNPESKPAGTKNDAK